MLIFLDTDDVRISYQQGNCDIAVVAFAGIGRGLGTIQTEEFKKSLKQTAVRATPSTIYVIDKQRRWFNDGVSFIVEGALSSLVGILNPKRVVTIGNSMGGFGALIFAKRIEYCERSIAFAPQSSVQNSIVGFESRWSEHVGLIKQWDVPDATEEVGGQIDYHIFYGSDDPLDALHAKRFRDLNSPNVIVNMIAKCGHDVVRKLKEDGLLKPILDQLIWDEPAAYAGLTDMPI
jgi:hypothetical protein